MQQWEYHSTGNAKTVVSVHSVVGGAARCVSSFNDSSKAGKGMAGGGSRSTEW
jgi:hypothetical protein